MKSILFLLKLYKISQTITEKPLSWVRLISRKPKNILHKISLKNPTGNRNPRYGTGITC